MALGRPTLGRHLTALAVLGIGEGQEPDWPTLTDDALLAFLDEVAEGEVPRFKHRESLVAVARQAWGAWAAMVAADVALANARCDEHVERYLGWFLGKAEGDGSMDHLLCALEPDELAFVWDAPLWVGVLRLKGRGAVLGVREENRRLSELN